MTYKEGHREQDIDFLLLDQDGFVKIIKSKILSVSKVIFIGVEQKKIFFHKGIGLLLSMDDDNNLNFWDLEKCSRVKTMNCKGALNVFFFHGDDSIVIESIKNGVFSEMILESDKESNVEHSFQSIFRFSEIIDKNERGGEREGEEVVYSMSFKQIEMLCSDIFLFLSDDGYFFIISSGIISSKTLIKNAECFDFGSDENDDLFFTFGLADGSVENYKAVNDNSQDNPKTKKIHLVKCGIIKIARHTNPVTSVHFTRNTTSIFFIQDRPKEKKTDPINIKKFFVLRESPEEEVEIMK